MQSTNKARSRIRHLQGSKKLGQINEEYSTVLKISWIPTFLQAFQTICSNPAIFSEMGDMCCLLKIQADHPLKGSFTPPLLPERPIIWNQKPWSNSTTNQRRFTIENVRKSIGFCVNYPCIFSITLKPLTLTTST